MLIVRVSDAELDVRLMGLEVGTTFVAGVEGTSVSIRATLPGELSVDMLEGRY